MATASQEQPSCTCKKLPLCLSSFTAAEYGDLHSLSTKTISNKPDVGGYTPLHYAAQHGHVGATILLLNTKKLHVDGGLEACATPLHRAAFAGSVATARLLIAKNANLLARDSSFGDGMTPLHKAAAGGRHLMVKLLIDALGEQVDEAMQLKDTMDRTPVQVARETERDHDSVKRWDLNAGGSPDWDQCVRLLETADKAHTSTKRTTTITALPSHLGSDRDCCGEDGRCLTMSWETAFRSVLVSSVQESIGDAPAQLSSGAVPTGRNAADVGAGALPETAQEAVSSEPKPASTKPKGKSCANCGTETFAFFRVKGLLVCQSCTKLTRRGRRL